MMTYQVADLLAEQLRAAARRAESASDYDALLEEIGDARVVLVGEASHGTHEFYRERALLTNRLIKERGFAGVAVEADWPDAWDVNTYVHGRGEAANAERALGGFERFPTWMWRNTVVLEFVEWLRDWNLQAPTPAAMVGFYGLDLYSLYRSIESVIAYLDEVDPEAAGRARLRYACFDEIGDDAQRYGYSAAYEVDQSCEDHAVQQLLDLRQQSEALALRDGQVAEDNLFDANQNARVVQHAEEYYRSMFGGRVSTWNLRDQHMAESLEHLQEHLTTRRGSPAKLVVWAHNSHLGDARATEMGRRGELNVGQLAREVYGGDSFNIGFTTYDGTVTAASDWGEPPQRMRVRPALDESWEAVFHHLSVEAAMPNYYVCLREGPLEGQPARLERAIGVIYRPQRERYSHYFEADLARQFDAVIHIDRTTALEPLERTPQWLTDEPPETYPFAE